MGNAQLAEANFGAAIGVFSKALEIDSTSVEALLQRSGAYFSAGKFTESVGDANKVLSIDAHNERATIRKGYVWS